MIFYLARESISHQCDSSPSEFLSHADRKPRVNDGSSPTRIVRIDGYEEWSPVFCESGIGYCEGALEMMGVPGRPSVVEVTCQCAGDPACVFELAW